MNTNHVRIRELADQLVNESNVLVVDDRISTLQAILKKERRTLNELNLSEEQLDRIRLQAYEDTLALYRDLFLESPFKLAIAESIQYFADLANELKEKYAPLALIDEGWIPESLQEIS